MLRNIQKLSRVKFLLLVTALVYTGCILYLSLINLSDTPVSELGMSDKVMHAGAYLVLGLLWMLHAVIAFERKNLSVQIFIIAVASIAFGIFIEVLQDRLTTYRQLDLYDILANSLGVVMAVMLVWILKDFLIRLKAKLI